MPLPISNALREARPQSISELYSRNFEDLSDEEIDRIIADQRANAERMAVAEAAGKRAPRERKEKLDNTSPPPINLDIEELKL